MNRKTALCFSGLLLVAAGPATLAAQPLTPGPAVRVAQGSLYPRSLAVGPGGGFGVSWLAPSSSAGQLFTPGDLPAGAPLSQNQDVFPDGFLFSTRGPEGFVALRVSKPFSDWTGPLIARLLDTAGRPVAPELVLVDHAKTFAVAGDPAGGFVLAWTDLSKVYARRFAASGVPVTATAEVGPDVQVHDVALLPGGGFVVAQSGDIWSSANRFPVTVRRFGPDGLPTGPAYQVAAENTEGYSGGAHVTADGAGRSIVAWGETDWFHTGTYRLRARRFDPSGQPLGPAFLVAESTEAFLWDLDLAARPDGSFLVVWNLAAYSIFGGVEVDGVTDFRDVLGRAYDAAQEPLGPPFLVSDDAAGMQDGGLVEASAGGWLTAWFSGPLPGGVTGGVFVRRIAASCGSATGLCLNGDRFRAEVAWKVPATGQQGSGTPIPLTNDTGAFWFFAPANYELVVKVLDGTAVNGHFWVFYGSLTNVQFSLTVTDTLTGRRRTYFNPAGTMASQADTLAF